ncbi:hypothetical protein CCACVL1_13694 [Corchorus capsularis]|uniref:Pyridoxal phosphate-dependent transferase n=1 Tax=Corchorus capsularis TaxID=210143 RepID=A0A1R3IA80_COCAP|nr:hypothetical protein CCACVL1_13694 [Corchorus capsularis]
MGFMNVSEDDYTMILTANQSSAFKLIAESYPFQCNQNLLTVYDYQSEAVEVMIESSKKRGANVMSGKFSWPNLKVNSEKLRKKILNKSKNKKKGLFVFPLQSRVTGSRKISASVLKDSDSATATTCAGIVNLVPPSKSAIYSRIEAQQMFDEFPTQEIKRKQKTVSFSEIEEVIDTSIESSNTLQSKNLKIECRGLDHADSLGLILISSRTRSLINWLVNALMSLEHPHSETGIPVVKIYGPKIMFDRGPAVAFNVFDWKGEKIDPGLVQKLADRNNISLSIGILQHIWFSDKNEEDKEKQLGTRTSEGITVSGGKKRDKFHCGISVVTASLSFLTNFEDIYRVWAFVSRFLDADFLEKEKWRYKALNQKTIEI